MTGKDKYILQSYGNSWQSMADQIISDTHTLLNAILTGHTHVYNLC